MKLEIVHLLQTVSKCRATYITHVKNKNKKGNMKGLAVDSYLLAVHLALLLLVIAVIAVITGYC